MALSPIGGESDEGCRVLTPATSPALESLYHSLATLGFRFVELKPNSKRPRHEAWQRNSTNIPPSRGNVGIIPPDGYFVVDVDSDEALTHCRSIAQWSEQTLTVKTPRGYHYYWSHPTRVGQTAGATLFGNGVDTRGPNVGYVVGPGATSTRRRITCRTMCR